MATPDPAEAAQILRRLLAAVERGELSADMPVERGIVRQIEGAAVALEALATRRGRSRRAATPESEES